MVETTEKDRRLANWQHRLDSPAATDQLKAAGLLDPEEAHDLRKWADAAFSHYVEDTLTRELNQ